MPWLKQLLLGACVSIAIMRVLGYPVVRGIVRDARADEVIKRMARRFGNGAVVVTSDREVVRFAETAGATAVSSEEFDGRMGMAVVMEEKGVDTEEAEREIVRRGTKKKGPARGAF